ncbi:MAG: hypothetical protein J5367_07115 [Lachnospiraceae bacterium]|nr:hypothetical protein [Lachnospiraceae bacterium]
MVRLIKDNKQVELGKLSNLYPLCSYLVKIDDISSTEGTVLAVSDSVDTDNEIADMMHEYLNKNILCFIGGDHVHDGVKHVIGSLR